MKNKTAVSLAVGGLLALAAGCGKTENAAPPTEATDQATTEKLVPQKTNAMTGATEVAKMTPAPQ